MCIQAVGIGRERGGAELAEVTFSRPFFARVEDEGAREMCAPADYSAACGARGLRMRELGVRARVGIRAMMHAVGIFGGLLRDSGSS